MVKFLLDNGASEDHKDIYDKTAKDYAFEANFEEVTKKRAPKNRKIADKSDASRLKNPKEISEDKSKLEVFTQNKYKILELLEH